MTRNRDWNRIYYQSDFNNEERSHPLTNHNSHDLETWFNQNKRNINQLVFTFGKYKGRPVATIVKEDPRYCNWLYNNTKEQYKGTKFYYLLEHLLHP